jgi:hypothetical protein
MRMCFVLFCFFFWGFGFMYGSNFLGDTLKLKGSGYCLMYVLKGGVSNKDSLRNHLDSTFIQMNRGGSFCSRDRVLRGGLGFSGLSYVGFHFYNSALVKGFGLSYRRLWEVSDGVSLGLGGVFCGGSYSEASDKYWGEKERDFLFLYPHFVFRLGGLQRDKGFYLDFYPGYFIGGSSMASLGLGLGYELKTNYFRKRSALRSIERLKASLYYSGSPLVASLQALDERAREIERAYDKNRTRVTLTVLKLRWLGSNDFLLASDKLVYSSLAVQIGVGF